MVSGKLFFWFVLIPAVFGSDDTKHIWCTNDDIRRQINLVQGIKAEEMLCQAESTKRFPWETSDIPRITPGAPDSMKAEYRIYRLNGPSDSRQIAVFVSWLHKVQNFKHVEKYHIELSFINPYGTPLQYLMQWDKNLTSAVMNTSAIFLEFHFIYLGNPGSYLIHHDDIYSFKLQSCPVYRFSHASQAIKKYVKIPGCDNEKISRTVGCLVMNEDVVTENFVTENFVTTTIASTISDVDDFTTLQSSTTERIGSKPIHFILVAIGCLLIVGVLVTLFCICRRRKNTCCMDKKPQFAVRSRRVLLVCTLDEQFSNLINRLIVMLNKAPGLEVKCNLRRTIEIGNQGVHNWAVREISNADVVAFVVANTRELENLEGRGEEMDCMALHSIERRQLGAIVKATEKICLNSKGSIAEKTFILVDITNCSKQESTPYFKHMKLPAELGNFLKMVVGEDAAGRHDFSSDEKSFRECLDNVQKKFSQNVAQNNLDRTSSTSENDLSLLPRNVTFDGPPSCESNHSRLYVTAEPPSHDGNVSQSYVTTDFNDDRDRRERFRHTGAVPKV